jgi:hypothetical protein
MSSAALETFIPMASKIAWRLMFRVRDRRAFNKCRARAEPLLGSDCEWGEGRPYWKISELWECDVAMRSSHASVADQVLNCLLAAQRLASGWYIFGTLSPEKPDGFSGVFSIGPGSSSSIPGLEWASFDFV